MYIVIISFFSFLYRWNKLEMISYDSVSREDGEVIPLVLKHERPFWFSKVRSYVQ